ncbi:MAG TPA: DASS family sodium-coupled anion symporter [Longimicrobium sp.]|nr:DASS family sodium-coupled anion symporter [Longimicrobium sp.]
MTDSAGETGNAGPSRVQRIGVAAGPAAFALLALLPAPGGLGAAGWRVAAVGVWMAVWWMSEAVPLAVTALLPLLLFPLLGTRGLEAAARPYADPVVFLFMGGFMLAGAMQRWGLHRRIALTIVRAMGTRPAGLVGGFMAATAFISMWVNNTATVLMMLPIALSVVELVESCDADEPNFPPAILLGVVYAAAIGGLGTLIGTPPNALLAAFLDEAYGIHVGFLQWMLVGVPLVLALLPLSWLLVTRVVLPLGRDEVRGGRALIAREVGALGRIGRAEWTVAAVFVLTDALWIARPWLAEWIPGLTDAGIALAGAALLFVLPAGTPGGERVLDWDHAGGLPWDVLLLFGGGLSLAEGIAATGLGRWIGESLGGVGAWPPLAVAVLVAAVLVALSEVASNTAAAVTFLPVIASLGVAVGQGPLVLAVVATLAASGGFVLPVASPPNAIAYATGRITMRQMVRAGLWMDALFALLLPILAVALIRLALGG